MNKNTYKNMVNINLQTRNKEYEEYIQKYNYF